MYCVNCGRTSAETQLFSVNSLSHNLKSCEKCFNRYVKSDIGEFSNGLTREAHRQLLYNRDGVFPALGVKCKFCGEDKCLWNLDGTQNVLCQDCNGRRVQDMVKAGVV